uniref:Uncharacterized protein n=1 Tax=Aegilops tauschii subsp. strangulata TaxID=200361 RepID=A0A453G1S8_AEGTS
MVVLRCGFATSGQPTVCGMCGPAPGGEMLVVLDLGRWRHVLGTYAASLG